jgi:hypothetical protein
LILPELVVKEITPPFPAFPETEYEDESNFERERLILPELVAKEITPPFPAFPEYEYETESEYEKLRLILPELVAKEITPPFPAFPESEYENEDELIKMGFWAPLRPTSMSPRPYTRISPPFAPVLIVLVSTSPRMDIVPGKVLGLN